MNDYQVVELQLSNCNGDWDAPTSQLSKLYGGSIISSPSSHDSVSLNHEDDTHSFDSISIGDPALEKDFQPVSDVIFSSKELTIAGTSKKCSDISSSIPSSGTTISHALLTELKMRRDVHPLLASMRPRHPRQRPNCLFLNHMGSRVTPSKASTTRTAAAAVEAVLDMDDDSILDLPDPFFEETRRDREDPPGTPPATRSATSATNAAVADETLSSDHAVDPVNPSPKTPLRSPPSSPCGFAHSDFPDVSLSHSSGDTSFDDFIGMPNEFVLDSPTEHALVMVPNQPVGPPTDSPACFPSESPSRRCQVIDVGVPTDDLVCLPPMSDPEGLGIGVVTPTCKPRALMRTPKKEIPLPRKVRKTHGRHHTQSANTLETQYYRQTATAAASRRYYPGAMTVPSSSSLPGQRMQTKSFPVKARPSGWYGRNPYRRSYGLAPLPYSHPTIVSPSSTRPTYSSLPRTTTAAGVPPYPSPPPASILPRPQPHPRSWQS